MSVASAQLDPLQIGVTDAASFQATTGASDRAMEDLRRFREMLTDWNEKMNLVGPASLPNFWNRHAWDSAQLLTYAPDARIWADLGAGAGLPGVVLAILLKDTEGGQIHLVESMAKRCRFLTEVVSELDLPAQIHNARAEDLSLKVDIVTARACAPLDRLLGYARPYFKRGATALFLKGQDVVSELTHASKYWKFNSDLKPSLSDPRGFVLQVKGLSSARSV